MQVWSIATSPGEAAPKHVGEGDAPAIAPGGDRVAFEKDHRIWIAPIDGSKPAEPAFFARGSSVSPVRSPDGRSLAFVSDRDDHSFIGIFTDASEPIRYLSTSTARDDTPLWSEQGREMAFVRQPGTRRHAALAAGPTAAAVVDPDRRHARTSTGTRRSIHNAPAG